MPSSRKPTSSIPAPGNGQAAVAAPPFPPEGNTNGQGYGLRHLKENCPDGVEIGRADYLAAPIDDSASWADLADANNKVRYLLKQWIPYDMLTGVVGDSKAGKSHFLLWAVVRPIIRAPTTAAPSTTTPLTSEAGRPASGSGCMSVSREGSNMPGKGKPFVKGFDPRRKLLTRADRKRGYANAPSRIKSRIRSLYRAGRIKLTGETVYPELAF